MKRIGIICAMQKEMDTLLDAMDNPVKIKKLSILFYEGVIGNNEIVISLCGIGKVNAAMATTMLIDDFECNLIINSGIAGGVAPLKKRDSVIATSLTYNDVDVRAFGYSFGQVPGLPKEFIVNPELVMLVKKIFNKLSLDYKCKKIVSGDQFVTSKDQLKNVDIPDGYATEMEGTAIAQVCTRAGVDFIVLRYISDIVGEENQEEEYAVFESEMADRSARVTLALVENLM